jgi:hypothetical protein
MATQATKEELARHEKVQAEIAKLIAETSKINSENRWYPAIVGASVTLVLVAIVKNLL